MKAKNVQEMLRIAVFYDGNYLLHASNYYNYFHARRNRLSIEGIHAYLRENIAHDSDRSLHLVHIVDAHYFRGRLSAADASQKGDLLYAERAFEDILMDSGITTHFLPVKSTNGKRVEKGIDVWFALEVYENVRLNNYDYVVLVTGDGDFVPLVKRLNLLGVKTILLHFDYEYQVDDSDRKISSFASTDLKEWAFKTIDLAGEIDNPKNKSSQSIADLFIGPPKITNMTYTSVGSALRDRPESESRRKQSTIMTLKTGYGFIRWPELNNVYFFYQALTNADFEDLVVGDTVEFEIEERADGETDGPKRYIAKSVRLIR